MVFTSFFYGQTSYILVIRILVVGSSRKRRIKILELKVRLSKFNIDQVGLEDLQGVGYWMVKPQPARRINDDVPPGGGRVSIVAFDAVSECHGIVVP